MTMMRYLDPHLLQAFVATADIGTVVGAAAHLNRTQAAVSMQIRKLEDHVGTMLFERGPRGLKMTSNGHMLMSYAREILSLNDTFIAHLGGNQEKGRLRLGVVEDFVATRLIAILSQYRAENPAIQIDIIVQPNARLAAMFDSKMLDAVICDVSGIHRKPLGVWSERLYWAVRDDFTIHYDRPLPIVMFDDACPWRAAAIATLARAGVDWRIVSEASTLLATSAAVRAGLGAAPMMNGTVPRGCRIIQPIPDSLCPVEITIGLFANAHPTLEARAFIDIVTSGSEPRAIMDLRAMSDDETAGLLLG
ncbi:LysR family transcriptional regulator [Georhizobium profundi]|jgi:DNA-binding transcriptional LysR family regulator|uniref:LysR family transcriptional regulator n=2 Tax=Georhizobium profundi TaxID=2341112 RepID=A0A3Q8XQE2_9HYPH|nr:LysR family transcriptional regulator [Georhizobium profundi]